MKREDLVRLVRTQQRTTFVVLVLLLVGVGLTLSGTLEKLNPSLSLKRVVPALGLFIILAVVVFAQRGIFGLPKCPHCKRLLSG